MTPEELEKQKEIEYLIQCELTYVKTPDELIVMSGFHERALYNYIAQMANHSDSPLKSNTTLRLCKFDPSTKKHGSDAKIYNVDAKPTNISFDNEMKKSPARLNGYFHFSDLSKKLHEEKLQSNLLVLASGYVWGKVMYIIQIPYEAVKERMLHNTTSKAGQRNASCNYNHWRFSNDERIKLLYLAPNDRLEKHYISFDSGFYAFLVGMKKHELININDYQEHVYRTNKFTGLID